VPAEHIRLIATDLGEWDDDAAAYDLVTASFFHSPVALERTAVLRRAAERVAPGGHLLITSHAGVPFWVHSAEGQEHRFLTPEEEIEELALDDNEWSVMISETRTRQVTGPDGQEGTLDDGVVLLRRR
jgi:hypothetical protein